jgi:hypothetical protein
MATGSIKNIASFNPTIILNSSNDMNSVDCGSYYQSGGSASMPANAPAGAYNAYIFVCKARDNDRFQFWYSANTGIIYTRVTFDWANGSSSNWTEWKSIIPA